MATRNNNNAFLFRKDWREAIAEYPAEDRLAIREAIEAYAFDGIIPEDRFLKAATANARVIIDRDRDMYQERCDRNKENARKRWERMQSHTTASNGIQIKQLDANIIDNNNGIDNDIDIEPTPKVVGDIKEDKEKTSKEVQKKAAPDKRFSKPTPQDVQAYCDERGNGITGEAFCDFYESKGWKVGNSPMKDWKAAVRTWEKRDGRSAGSAKKQAPAGVKLGVGEWIDENGERRYGTGNLPPVPMSAPPRPNSDMVWSRESKSWIPPV